MIMVLVEMMQSESLANVQLQLATSVRKWFGQWRDVCAHGKFLDRKAPRRKVTYRATRMRMPLAETGDKLVLWLFFAAITPWHRAEFNWWRLRHQWRIRVGMCTSGHGGILWTDGQQESSRQSNDARCDAKNGDGVAAAVAHWRLKINRNGCQCSRFSWLSVACMSIQQVGIDEVGIASHCAATRIQGQYETMLLSL